MPDSMKDFLNKISAAGKPAETSPSMQKTADGYYIGYAGLKPLEASEDEEKPFEKDENGPGPGDDAFYKPAYAGLRDVDELSSALHGDESEEEDEEKKSK